MDTESMLPPGQNYTRALFDDGQESVDTSFGGSFAAGEMATCPIYTPSGPICPAQPHRYDLATHLLPGQAYLIYANGTDVDPGGTGITLGLEGDEPWLDYEVDYPEGEARLVGHLVRVGTEPVDLVVHHLFSTEAMEYTLDVQIRLLQGPYLPGVPVALDVHSSASAVRFAPEEDASVQIWDGDDRFLGRFALAEGRSLDLTDVSTRQALVLQFFNATLNTTIEVLQDDGAAASLRHLATNRQRTSAGSVTGLAEEEWPLEVTEVPFGFGLYFGGDGEWSTWQTRFYLQGPEGEPSFEVTYGCIVCGGWIERGLPYGEEPLPLGTYALGVSSNDFGAGISPPAVATGIEVGHYVVSYVR